jgi:hypothetical protein
MSGLAAVVFLLVFCRSMTRDLDLDEHQFVAPPLLLLQQNVHPYADYPYFHMPGLVCVYAVLFRYAPYPLLTARLFSVLCGTATVLLMFHTGWRLVARGGDRRRCWVVAGGLSAMFLTCRLFTYTNGWAWNHDSAVLCALLALLCHVRGLRTGRIVLFAAAGFFLACATGIRLSFAFCFVPFAASVLFGAAPMNARWRLAALGAAILAAVQAFLPAVVLLLEAPREFVFGNLRYPRLNTQFYREARSGAMDLPGKAYHLGQTFVSDPGNLALLVLFVAAVVVLVRVRAWRSPRGGEVVLLLGLIVALLAGSWGPTPTQYQYYYQMLPFMVLAIFHAVARHPAAAARWVRAVGVAAVVVVATGLPRWYWPVVRVFSPQRWTPVAVHNASVWLKRHTPPGGRVLTTDTAVPLEAGLTVYPEYAVGRHALHIGRFMSADERRTLRIAYGEELGRVLAERPADAVFVDRRVLGDCTALIEYATARGFRPMTSPDGAYELWVRPEGSAELPLLGLGDARNREESGRENSSRPPLPPQHPQH